ncbi:MAG: DUF5658 family protein [Acidimicrobiia bacterium]|nr:DUF5658 family protein [Acidimicrobiia bacterium]
MGELAVEAPEATPASDLAQVSTAMVLFTILVGLNLGDMILTHVGLQRGVLEEANPLMRDVVANLWTAAAVKVAALALVGWFMYLIRARIRVVQGTLVVAIVWYTLVVTWNAAIVLDLAPLR